MAKDVVEQTKRQKKREINLKRVFSNFLDYFLS